MWKCFSVHLKTNIHSIVLHSRTCASKDTGCTNSHSSLEEKAFIV